MSWTGWNGANQAAFLEQIDQTWVAVQKSEIDEVVVEHLAEKVADEVGVEDVDGAGNVDAVDEEADEGLVREEVLGKGDVGPEVVGVEVADADVGGEEVVDNETGQEVVGEETAAVGVESVGEEAVDEEAFGEEAVAGDEAVAGEEAVGEDAVGEEVGEAVGEKTLG